MLAKIYRPAKSAMQSGKAGRDKWRLEFVADQAPFTDALMGWTGARDARGQVRMSFDTKEQAIAFARAHNIPHQLADNPAPKRIIKAYADNFSYKRREPWSH
jgi:ETC complex I subunit conserved region